MGYRLHSSQRRSSEAARAVMLERMHDRAAWSQDLTGSEHAGECRVEAQAHVQGVVHTVFLHFGAPKAGADVADYSQKVGHYARRQPHACGERNQTDQRAADRAGHC